MAGAIYSTDTEMASVEDIYQKIRRGETARFETNSADEAELAAGIERIRGRLEGTSLEARRPVRAKTLRPNVWHWVAPTALAAALALIAFIFFPGLNTERQPEPQIAQGTVWQMGPIEVRMLSPVQISREFSAAEVTIQLNAGVVAIKRTDPKVALVINTPQGTLTAKGTILIIAHKQRTSIELLEGRADWTHSKQTMQLDRAHPRTGDSLKEWRDQLPVDFHRPTLNGQKPSKAATAFKKNACVIYTLNGMRREGVIKEVIHGEYRVSHQGIDEPDLLSASDLLGCGRAESKPEAGQLKH